MLLQGRSCVQLEWFWTHFLSTTQQSWRISVKPGTPVISWLNPWVGGYTQHSCTLTHRACNCSYYPVQITLYTFLVYLSLMRGVDTTVIIITAGICLCWFIQTQWTSILEAQWVSTSASLISTPGLCSHQRYWVFPSHTSQVRVFIYTCRFFLSCI